VNGYDFEMFEHIWNSNKFLINWLGIIWNKVFMVI
jgi:hypothetical protein